VNGLVLRAPERDVATPLVRDDAPVHGTANNPKNLLVEEELRDEAGWLERHGKKMTIGSTVRVLSVVFEVREENGPEAFSTCFDRSSWELRSEDAVSAVMQLEDFIVCDHHRS
jgi:hypothetical protein